MDKQLKPLEQLLVLFSAPVNFFPNESCAALESSVADARQTGREQESSAPIGRQPSRERENY